MEVVAQSDEKNEKTEQGQKNEKKAGLPSHFDLKDLRNMGIAAHIDAGKTTCY